MSRPFGNRSELALSAVGVALSLAVLLTACTVYEINHAMNCTIERRDVFEVAVYTEVECETIDAGANGTAADGV